MATTFRFAFVVAIVFALLSHALADEPSVPLRDDFLQPELREYSDADFSDLLRDAQFAEESGEKEISDVMHRNIRLALPLMDDAFRRMRGYQQLGVFHMGRREYSDAFRSFCQAIHAARDSDFESLAWLSLISMAEQMQRIGHYRSALECFRQVASRQDLSNPITAVRARFRQALLEIELELHEPARESVNHLRSLMHPQEEWRSQVVENLLRISQGKAGTVLEELRLVFQYDFPEQASYKDQYLHWILANAHFAEGNFTTSGQHLDALLAVPNLEIEMDQVNLLAAQNALALGDLHLAELESRKLFRKSPHVLVALAARDVLVEVAKRQGNIERALDLLETTDSRFRRDYRTLVELDNISSTETLRLQQQLESTESQVREFETQNQFLAQRNAVTSTALGFAFLAILLGIALIGFRIVLLRLRKERLIAELEKRNSETLSKLVDETKTALDQQISERIELEKFLERKRRDEAIGKLTGNVAHDFNNLLQVIISTNEYLRSRELNFSSTDTELISTSTQSARIGASIVRQLLAYARQQVLSPKAIMLGDFFAGTSELLRAAVTAPCSLKIDNACQEDYLKIDPSQLTTALLNLLTNAQDAMPDGGRIQIVVRRIGTLPTDLHDWPNMHLSKSIAIEVIDEGKGISDDAAAHAFEPFFTTKPSAAGTGLGLSSVHGFVRQSGGDVGIFPNSEGGVRVTMVFPESNDRSEGASFENDQTGLAPQGHVLLVEDNQFVAQSIQNDLEYLGFQVDWLTNGRAAIDAFLDGGSYDAIVSDVRMPGEVSGVDLRDWIRQNYPDTGFILMSGYTYVDEHMERSSFLQKPFTRMDLLQALKNESQYRRRVQDDRAAAMPIEPEEGIGQRSVTSSSS